ncbi:MAG: ABC transporter ATP-binding protein [Microcoleaceae cyanobacterium]
MHESTAKSQEFISSILEKYQSDRPFLTLINLYREDVTKIGLSMILYTIKHSPEWIKPLVIANVIDIISEPQNHSVSELWLNGIILGLAVVQNIPTHYLHVRLLSNATRKMEFNLRSIMTRRLQHLSIGFYQQKNTGALQLKLLRDVEAISQLTNQVFQYLPAIGLNILVAISVTAVRAPQFLIFFLGTVPVATILIRLLRNPIRDRNQKLREEMEKMSAHLVEMIKLIPVTRAHGAENTEIERTEAKLTKVRQKAVRLDQINAIAGASSWVTLRLFGFSCLITSAWLAYTGQWGITAGDVVLLTGYFDSLTMSVIQVMNILPQIGKGFDSLSSIGEILESPDLEHNVGKETVTQVDGDFRFESVGFTYPAHQEEAIKDFSLTVKPGETVAIVGPSGAGKSTLLNLIIGFLRPTVGSIQLDGVDMNTLDLRTYRKFLSVVPQETILFEGTVRENILYGSDLTNEKSLWQAIKDANALEFISKLPKGIDSRIGENGIKLSGGQRQRLAIARALIRNPRVLILDEATAALDNTSEALIQEALERLLTNRTTFVVAHRLSTIRKATRIVVLEGGRMVEMGSHSQLLANRGLFASLHSLRS